MYDQSFQIMIELNVQKIVQKLEMHIAAHRVWAEPQGENCSGKRLAFKNI